MNPDDLSDVDPVEGPHIHITVVKMKNGKAAGPSGIVAAMLKAAGITSAVLLAELANALISDNAIPWKIALSLTCTRSKVNARERGNYRGLKLL